MSKKRKTLKEKKLAELRRLKEPRVDESSTLSTFSYSFSQEKKATPVITYSLQSDLRKTLLVSFGILLFLLLLSSLLHNHAFVLPLVSRY